MDGPFHTFTMILLGAAVSAAPYLWKRLCDQRVRKGIQKFSRRQKIAFGSVLAYAFAGGLLILIVVIEHGPIGWPSRPVEIACHLHGLTAALAMAVVVFAIDRGVGEDPDDHPTFV